LTTVRNCWSLLLIAALLSACAVGPGSRESIGISSYLPKEVPDGWIADFSYDENLRDYLRRQSHLAERSGKQAFVFFFAEWCAPCVRIRNRASDADLSSLFERKHIVMINFDYMNLDQIVSQAFVPGKIKVVPALALLGKDGTVPGQIVYGSAWRDAVQGDDERVLRGFFDAVSK